MCPIWKNTTFWKRCWQRWYVLLLFIRCIW